MRPSIKRVIITIVMIGCISLGIGVFLYIQDIQHKSIHIQYDHLCTPFQQQCQVDFYLPYSLPGPVHIFYQLTNFYQTHRRYFSSKHLEQLSGTSVGIEQLDSCQPIVTMQQLGINTSYTGQPISSDSPANPCGLMARSYFNDTYSLYSLQSSIASQLIIDSRNIAYPQDKTHNFKRHKQHEQTQWLDVENEHFIVWMRASASSSPKKLYG